MDGLDLIPLLIYQFVTTHISFEQKPARLTLGTVGNSTKYARSSNFSRLATNNTPASTPEYELRSDQKSDEATRLALVHCCSLSRFERGADQFVHCRLRDAACSFDRRLGDAGTQHDHKFVAAIELG
jgi:hypothetical protein